MNDDEFEQPDTMSIWRFLWPAIITLAILILSVLAAAYLPELNHWLDKTFDKSDQQKTGIVMLLVGSLVCGWIFLSR